MPGRKENWGGTREGAGRKPKWNSGKTTAIRIPEIFSDKLLELARYWDEGNSREPQFPELAQNLLASIPQSPAPADSSPHFDIVQNQHEIVQSQLRQRIEELKHENEQSESVQNQLQQRIEELERTHSQHESVQNQLQQRIEQLLCELHSEQARANSIDEKLKQASITINQLQAELKLIQEEKVILLAQIETYKREKEIANTDIQKVLDRLDYHTRSKKEKGGYEANNATALKNIVKNVLPELKKALKLLDNNLT